MSKLINIFKICAVCAALFSTFPFASAQDSAETSAEVVHPAVVQDSSANVASGAEHLRIARKIEQDSLNDSSKIRHNARGVVNFVRQNISQSLGDFLAIKVIGKVRVIGILFIVLTLSLAWSVRYIVAWFFNFLLRSKDGRTLRESRRIFCKLRYPISWFVLLSAFDTACLLLFRDPSYVMFTRRVSTILFFFLFAWALSIVSSGIFKLAEERMVIKYAATRNLLVLGERITRYCIYTFGLLMILSSCGAKIDAVITSLGIGGAALAFASKDTIANFFGSISLIIDRPFVVGDWISAGGVEGIVEFVGFRSTRIRTFPRTVVTIPNSVLANENVENWSKRNKRRVDMSVGLTYSTTADQMEEIVSDIKKLLRENPKIDSSDIRVWFSGFGASSLDISMMFYIIEIDPIPFGTELQRVNIAIMRAVAARGLSFAFPSQSVYIETMPKRA